MSTSAFSLHCIICYESFDRESRPPVVLPCGHTYLCQSCSERLTRCMECRVSLFRGGKTPIISALSMDEAFDEEEEAACAAAEKKSSLRAIPSGMTPSEAMEMRLPIPKNVVLMAMLDTMSTGRTGDDEVREGAVHHHHTTQHLQSNFGTFAIRAPRGLLIHRHGLPEPQQQPESSVEEEKEEEEQQPEEEKEEAEQPLRVSIVNCQSMDSTEVRLHSVQQHEKERQPPPPYLEETEEEQEVLLYGQTVQVVSYNGEIAVLARNRGYLKATPDELVKVGDAKDEACRIEGLLTSLELEEDVVRGELDSLDRRIAALEKQLEDAVSAPYEETLIVPPTRMISMLEEQDEEEADASSNHHNPTTAPTTPSRKPAPSPSSAFITPSRTMSTHSMPPPLSLPPNMGGWVAGDQQVVVASSPATPSRINFRTGMSGHMGLTVCRRSHSTEVSQPPRQVRLMGEHRGVGRIGLMRK